MLKELPPIKKLREKANNIKERIAEKARLKAEALAAAAAAAIEDDDEVDEAGVDEQVLLRQVCVGMYAHTHACTYTRTHI